ncbi:hypothetical protein HDU96_004708, partial [Phlyctochytrium bullatum]
MSTTPAGYYFVDGLTADPLTSANFNFTSEDCIAKTAESGACVVRTIATATSICNKYPQCSSFICWNPQYTTLDYCYLFGTPANLTESTKLGSVYEKQGYIKQGAIVGLKGPVSTIGAPPPQATLGTFPMSEFYLLNSAFVKEGSTALIDDACQGYIERAGQKIACRAPNLSAAVALCRARPTCSGFACWNPASLEKSDECYLMGEKAVMETSGVDANGVPGQVAVLKQGKTVTYNNRVMTVGPVAATLSTSSATITSSSTTTTSSASSSATPSRFEFADALSIMLEANNVNVTDKACVAVTAESGACIVKDRDSAIETCSRMADCSGFVCWNPERSSRFSPICYLAGTYGPYSQSTYDSNGKPDQQGYLKRNAVVLVRNKRLTITGPVPVPPTPTWSAPANPSSYIRYEALVAARGTAPIYKDPRCLYYVQNDFGVIGCAFDNRQAAQSMCDQLEDACAGYMCWNPEGLSGAKKECWVYGWRAVMVEARRDARGVAMQEAFFKANA